MHSGCLNRNFRMKIQMRITHSLKMNLTLSFAIFTALLQMSLSIFEAEITQESSAVKDAQTLLQIADEFLYCFMDQSSEKFPPTVQPYMDGVSRVIRSFASQNDSSFSKAEAIVFQTSLATSLADNVVTESGRKYHPRVLPLVLQLISDCFTKITGYQPSKLVRRITSFLELLLEDVYHPDWNSSQTDNQDIFSDVGNLGGFVSQTQSLERSKSESTNEIVQPASWDISKTESTNKIGRLANDRRPRQTSQSFDANQSILMVSSSKFDPFSFNQELSKRTELGSLLNHEKQLQITDSFKVKEDETEHEASQLGLKFNHEKLPLVILPSAINYNYNYSSVSVVSRFSILFSDALKSSNVILVAFDTSLHPVLAGKAYYKAVYDVAFRMTSFNPVSIARTFAVAVKATFEDLTTFQHIIAYGNVVGNYLKSKGLLTPENISILCSSYVNFIKTAVASVRTRAKTSEANIGAIIEGLEKFLNSLRVFPTENFLGLATDFADNVFNLSGIKRLMFPSLSPVCSNLISNQIVNESFNIKINLEKSSSRTISKFHNPKNDLRDERSHNSNIFGNSKNCLSPSMISLFANTFSETASISENLANVFNRRLSRVVLSKTFFYTMYDYFLRLGISETSSYHISSTVSQLINANYFAITPVVMTNTISNVIGRKLFDQNLLSLKNFQQLSDLYVQFLETAFIFLDSNYTSESIIRSILAGSANFLSSQNISLAENVDVLATYFEKALNLSIKTAFIDEDFPPWSPWNEVSMTFYFDFFDQTRDADLSELNGTAAFSYYILHELSFYPHFSKFLNLPLITSTVDDYFHNSLFAVEGVTLQYLTDLILHKTSGKLDSFSFAKLFVKSLEKFLTARSVLKPENSISMARDFVSYLNEALKHKKDSDYFKLLMKTTGQFLTNLLIFGVDQTESWSSLLLSELSSRPNFILSGLIKENAPEVLSPSGLLSTESSTRVNNLALTTRIDILSLNKVNVSSFTYQLIVGVLQINNGNPKLKPEKALIQALLEGVSALIGLISGAYITTLDVQDYGNEFRGLHEVISGFLDL